jgi:hypothetical protein
VDRISTDSIDALSKDAHDRRAVYVERMHPAFPENIFQTGTANLSHGFSLMTNELPRIEDSSGALASRFLMLILTTSLYGREDHRLLDRFIPIDIRGELAFNESRRCRKTARSESKTIVGREARPKSVYFESGEGVLR